MLFLSCLMQFTTLICMKIEWYTCPHLHCLLLGSTVFHLDLSNFHCNARGVLLVIIIWVCHQTQRCEGGDRIKRIKKKKKWQINFDIYRAKTVQLIRRIPRRMKKFMKRHFGIRFSTPCEILFSFPLFPFFLKGSQELSLITGINIYIYIYIPAQWL